MREFGYSIRRLVGQAFPKYSVSAQEEMSIDYFIQGLDVGELKVHVQLMHPITLESAISHAFEYESLKAESYSSLSKPHTAALHEGDNSCDISVENELKYYKGEVDKLKESLKKLMSAQDNVENRKTWQKRQKERNTRRRPQQMDLCFKCGSSDHYIADCPFGKDRPRVGFLPRNVMVKNRDKHVKRQVEKDRTGSRTAGLPDHQGYFVEGKIGGRIANFLVDTGSGYSIINEELFELLSEDEKPQMRPFNQQIKTVSGADMPIKGCGNFHIEIVGQVLDFPFVVAPSIDPVPLGTDLLRKLQASLDMNSSELIVNGVRYPLFRNTPVSCCRVEVKCTKNIPAQHEAQIECRIKSHGDAIPIEGVMEPSPNYQSKTGLLVSSAVVDTRSKVFPVTVINPHLTPIRVEADTSIGTLQEAKKIVPLRATSVLDETDSTRNGRNRVRVVPSHLQPLLDEAEQDLTATQYLQLQDLLMNYQEIFLGPEGELGHTSLSEHTIDTGDARPIKQPPRRVPLAQKTVVEAEINTMLKQGIIETSDSAWSSPVVLVTKKDGGVRFCVDYRRLNNVTKKDAYPLPKIDQCLDTLAGAQWFSTLDLASGYWQVPLAKRIGIRQHL